MDFPFQDHQDEDMAELLGTMIEVIYSFGVLFITCEVCQRSSQSLGESSDLIDQFEWYLFPAEIQRMMPMILQFTQQPFELICFGSTACNREAFKYVSANKVAEELLFVYFFFIKLNFCLMCRIFQILKTAWSYFMTLRQLY